LKVDQFTDATVAQALARQATQLALGDIQPTSVLRRVAESDPFDIGSCSLWFERLIERSLGVRVEVVANEDHRRAIGVACIQHPRDFNRPVGFGPSHPGGRLAEARERLGEHKDARRAIALILVIDAPAMPLRGGDRHSRLLEQLDRLFVHAQHGIPRIVGRRVGLEHFFQARHELGVLIRWDHPVFNLSLRHAVFF
jgi:hypothetical protein